jgi:Flp pilus assembly protein TadG
MRDAFRRLLSGEEGAALVEATIIAPILVAMGVYTADFGLLFFNKMEVQNAAQAGAQWAVANRVYNVSSIQTAGQKATSLSGVTVTPSAFCGCSTDSSGNPAVTQLASGTCTGTTNVVNSTCNSTGVVGNYVTVTATYAYTSFVPTRLIASTPIASTYTNSATTTVRIQ